MDVASTSTVETDESAPKVSVDGVRKVYGETTALEDASFTVRDGEFFTLLGPSGSGKSTLLRILGGLETATEGSVEIGGRSVRGVPPEDRPTSTVFQHLSLFPHKSVLENLTFGLKMQGVPSAERRERAEEMLELLGLPGYGDKDVDDLSGGEQQRIALGRSLLVNPEILLLDEPLSSLDVKLKQEMMLELKRIHDELGSTFLYVTHDQEVALSSSDRVAVMNDGEIVQVGTPDDIYEEPATTFVAEFVGDVNLLPATVRSLDDGRATVDIEGISVPATVPDGTRVGPGDAVTVVVRPERIGVGGDPDGGIVSGTVVERVYQGQSVLYTVEGDDVDLEFLVREPAGDAPFERGDRVSLNWSPGVARVLTE